MENEIKAGAQGRVARAASDAIDGRRCRQRRGSRYHPAGAGALTLALFLVTLPLSAGAAKEAKGNVVLHATVQPYARLAIVQPSTLTIIGRDSGQNYVSVPNDNNPAGSVLTVTSNNRAGFWLVFGVATSQQPLFTSIQVTGLSQTLMLSATGGKVLIPYTGRTTKITLAYRFNFVKDVKKGTYPWPLTISVQPA